MSFGMRIWDASGNRVLDVADRLTRLRYSVEVAAGVSGSIDLPDISGKLTAEWAEMINFSTIWQCPHEVSRSGTLISWIAPSFGSVNSLILVFLYT